MAFLSWIREKRNHLSNASRMQDRHKLLTVLLEAYRNQSENVANLTQHAEQMYYSHLRERLLQIVEEEQSYIPWLREKISILGGDVSQPFTSLSRGANTWENLRRDLEENRKEDDAFLSGLHIAERLDREIAEGLSRLRLDEQKHRAQLLDLLQKSAPDAVPSSSSQLEDMETQKRSWLGQQKMVWLEQRRSLWEAEGKPISWAEWIARREYEWTANELPNRELHWVQRLTMQVENDRLVPRIS